MKTYSRIVRLFQRGLFVLLGGLTLLSQAQDPSSSQPLKESLDLFLLAGQSNMAGRGQVADQDRVENPRVLTWTKEGTWRPATDPIHWDKSAAGVGLGRSFGLELVRAQPGRVVGLIPSACGGSPIRSWVPGGYHGQTRSHPYDDAIQRARAAMQHGTLKAILWHQGESDSNEKEAPLYKARLKELILRFRSELGQPDLPFIIGQLGQFPERPWSESRTAVDQAQRELAREMSHVAFVSSDALKCKSDHIHFDAPSLRTFGTRYAEAYLSMKP